MKQAIADAAGLGTVEIKAMKDHGYDAEFAVGVTAASATLGPIIPPSLPFVIYAMMANVSVGALFLAGILPGVLMALLMMVTVAYFAHKNGWGGDVKFSGSRFGRALIELAIVIAWPLGAWALVNKVDLPAQPVVFGAIVLLFVLDRIFRFQAVLPIMTPVLLIGGMTTGLFTPTEGAIAASAWAMFLGLVWYRTMNWKMFIKVSLDSVETTATVMFIVASASIFGWMLTATGVTAQIAEWVLGVTKEPWLFLLMANLLMLFVGCFLEPTAAITILVPILLPIVLKLLPFPDHQRRALAAVLPRTRWYATYGLTEAGPRVSTLPPELFVERADSVDLALAGVELEVRDGAGRPCRPGQTGMLFVRTPSLMNGYVVEGSPPLPAPTSAGGWYGTGDLATLDESGFLSLQGRVDRQTKFRGRRFNPAGVERCIDAHPGVVSANVAVNESGERLIAIAHIRRGQDSTLHDELLAHCRRNLPNALVLRGDRTDRRRSVLLQEARVYGAPLA